MLGRKSVVLICFIFAVSVARLFAKGSGDAELVINPTWVLAVTMPDMSAMPVSRSSLGEIASRFLVRRLSIIDKRRRFDEEEVYYRNAAWFANVKLAADAVVKKQQTRDALIFQGLDAWKFKSQAKKTDAELETLHTKLKEAEDKVYLVEKTPLIVLTDENKTQVYPPAPASGGELKFCANKKADAFLAWSVTEYFGRVDLKVKLWALYTRSYVFEDEILFSPENVESAVDKIAASLVEFLCSEEPAGIRVRSSQEDALITMNGSFRGRGETPEIVRNSGTVAIEVTANNHEPFTGEVDLASGTTITVDIDLPETPMIETLVSANADDTSVYRGGLYLGKTPLIFSSPLGGWEIVSAETGGNAFDYEVFATGKKLPPLNPKLPAYDGAVDRARRGFYGAYGRFWIALPTAMVLSAMFTSLNNALYSAPTNATQKELNTVQSYYIASGIAWGAMGLFAVESVGRLVFYVITANREKNPLQKPGANTKSNTFWDILLYGTLK